MQHIQNNTYANNTANTHTYITGCTILLYYVTSEVNKFESREIIDEIELRILLWEGFS